MPRWFVLCLLFVAACTPSPQKEGGDLVPFPDEENTALNAQVRYLTQLLDDQPRNAALWFRRGLLYAEANKENLAFTDFKQALVLDSSEVAYFYHLAEVQKQRGEIEEAYAAALRARNGGYQALALSRLVGELAFDLKRYGEAQQSIEKYLRVHPEDYEMVYRLAQVQFAAKDSAQAMESLLRLTEQQPEYEPPYQSLARVYLGYRNYPKGLQSLRMALKHVPKPSASLLTQYGETLGQIRKKDSAMYFFGLAVAANPKHWPAYHEAGLWHFRKEEYKKAMEYFNKVLALNAQHRAANYLNGFLLEYYFPDFEKALEYYRVAAQADPENRVIANAVQRVEGKILREKQREERRKRKAAQAKPSS
jgi:tetratricopeptide (TPR) repeat protein